MSRPRRVHFLLALILILSAGSTAFALSETDKDSIDRVADTWITSLKGEDIAGLRSTYWSDAVHTHIKPNGSREIKRGVAEILEGQQELFDSTDVFAQLGYPEPGKDLEGDPDRPVYLYNVEEFGYSDSFAFEKRNGRWKIVEHTLGPVK